MRLRHLLFARAAGTRLRAWLAADLRAYWVDDLVEYGLDLVVVYGTHTATESTFTDTGSQTAGSVRQRTGYLPKPTLRMFSSANDR